jgi:crotonobetainyl-CoA:carnitine CoA-transferase CaiB-like acyl-CoA transferase
MRPALLALATAVAVLSSAAASNTAAAQTTRVYREGPVVVISYIRTKPGMFDKYMEYLNAGYKTTLEAEKAAGLVTDYAIYTSDARTPADHDVMLTVTYKNWAAFDNLADRSDVVVNRALQNNPQQRNQAFADRSVMREALGTRTYQQLYLK